MMALVDAGPHDNVIDLVARPFETRDGVCLPLQLCERDMLGEVDAHGKTLPVDTVRSYLRQATAGLLHCHSNGVFHLDIKPDNMLLDNGMVKISDFGCAALASQGRVVVTATPPQPTTPSWFFTSSKRSTTPTPAAMTYLTSRKCGTTVYAAPEALQCRDGVSSAVDRASGLAHKGPSVYDAGKADVWSLGISMLVCLTGFFPWEAARVSDERYGAWLAAWRSYRDDAKHGRSGHGRASLVRLLCDLTVGSSNRRGLGDGSQQSLLELLVGMLNPEPTGRLDMCAVRWHEALVDATDDGGCGGSECESEALGDDTWSVSGGDMRACDPTGDVCGGVDLSSPSPSVGGTKSSGGSSFIPLEEISLL